MTFSQLVQQIGKTQEIETISQEIDGDLQDVALIDGMQEHYHKNTLYFGYDNQIKAGSPLLPSASWPVPRIRTRRTCFPQVE